MESCLSVLRKQAITGKSQARKPASRQPHDESYKIMADTSSPLRSIFILADAHVSTGLGFLCPNRMHFPHVLARA